MIDFGKCEDHSRLPALYKLLGAMSWKESYDVSKDKKELRLGSDWDMEVRSIFNSHFSPLLDGAYRFGEANVTEDIQRLFVNMVQESSDVNGVCQIEIDAPFLKRFVSRIQVVFLMNVIRYVQADLLRLLVAAGVEVYDGVDRAIPVVDRDHQYDGIFAGALIRMPFDVRMEMAELNLSVESLGWPCIFFIKRGNHVHVLGTTMVAAKNTVVSVYEGWTYESKFEEGLRLSGYFKCNPKPCDGWFGGLSDPNSKWCNKCSKCLGIGSFDSIMRGDENLLYSRNRSCSCDLMSADSNDESNINVGRFLMGKLYGNDWSSDGAEDCKFVAVSYEDSVKSFYRDALLASLEDLEKTL